MAPKIAETIPAKTVIEVGESDLFILARAVHRDAVRENNWTAYNMWSDVLRKYYPKEA